MRILIEGENLSNYLAKCHEAFRTGLRAIFDARCYGKGYPGYRLFTRSYEQVLKKTFPEGTPGLLIVSSWDAAHIDRGFAYHGLDQVHVPKALWLADYWSEATPRLEQYIQFVQKHEIDFVLSYFPQPLTLWKNAPLGKRLVFLPPCIDPSIFNDWQTPKTYDVGFLAAGTVNKTEFYPERHQLHQKLLGRKDLRYLWANHPGWQRHKDSHPLVGRNFSRAINSCKMFITTGGIYRNPHAKYFEILASRTLLIADEPAEASSLGLIDGITYVKMDTDNILDKVDYYLARPDLTNKIAEQGYLLAMRRHSCYTRAMDFFEALRDRGLGH